MCTFQRTLLGLIYSSEICQEQFLQKRNYFSISNFHDNHNFFFQSANFKFQTSSHQPIRNFQWIKKLNKCGRCRTFINPWFLQCYHQLEKMLSIPIDSPNQNLRVKIPSWTERRRCIFLINCQPLLLNRPDKTEALKSRRISVRK